MATQPHHPASDPSQPPQPPQPPQSPQPQSARQASPHHTPPSLREHDALLRALLLAADAFEREVGLALARHRGDPRIGRLLLDPRTNGQALAKHYKAELNRLLPTSQGTKRAGTEQCFALGERVRVAAKRGEQRTLNGRMGFIVTYRPFGDYGQTYRVWLDGMHTSGGVVLDQDELVRVAQERQ